MNVVTSLVSNVAMAQKITLAVVVLLFVTLMVASAVEAQSGYRSVYAVIGKIYCTINGSTGASGAATPVFPGASVQLVCVNSTSPNLTATTKADGTFTIQTYNPIPSDCKIVVPTPLSTCNSSLPATGGLISSLRSAGSIVLGAQKHFLYTPEGFSYAPDEVF